MHSRKTCFGGGLKGEEEAAYQALTQSFSSKWFFDGK